jgi:hypothetical protein
LKRVGLSVPSAIEKLHPASPSANHPTKPKLFE